MLKRLRCLAIISASLVLGTTGCTLKATINQTTDTTSNITGTTSGAGWWNEDGQIKPDFKATAFVSFNYDNLQYDLAAGQGEYLASVSRLLGVPRHQEPAFFSEAQAGYATMGDQGPTALLTFLRDRAQPFTN
jgi:hypothetical protein